MDHYLPESQDPTLHDDKNIAPYIYSPYLAQTVPDLLGHNKEFEDSQRDKGALIVFPRRLEQSNWANLRASIPLKSQGMWENETLKPVTLKVAHEALDIDMGMTKQELDVVSQFLVPGLTSRTVIDVWE